MGSGVDNQPTYTSLEEYFDELFAYSLSLGMSYKQFWEDDPFLLNSYVKAEEIKQAKRNNELWLQGLYVDIALATELSNLFSKSGRKKYISQPIAITKKEQERLEQEKVNKFKSQLLARVKGGKKDGI